jgi:hypothetical protein
MILKVGHVAPREPHQDSKGWQEADGKLGSHSNFQLATATSVHE